MKHNNFINYFTFNFSLYAPSEPLRDSLIFPINQKKLYSTVSLINKQTKSSMIIKDNKISFSIQQKPTLVFYIVKSDDISNKNDYDLPSINSSSRNTFNEHDFYTRLNISLKDKYYMYVDVFTKSQNLVFETDLIRILRHNPYLNMFYRKIEPSLLNSWIDENKLIEAFFLDDECTLHSIYTVEDKDNGINETMKSYYFKKQTLDIIDCLFKDKLVMNDVNVSQYYF